MEIEAKTYSAIDSRIANDVQDIVSLGTDAIAEAISLLRRSLASESDGAVAAVARLLVDKMLELPPGGITRSDVIRHHRRLRQGQAEQAMRRACELSHGCMRVEMIPSRRGQPQLRLFSAYSLPADH